MSAAVAIATAAGLIAGFDTAAADTDSYTQHSVEIGVWALNVYAGTDGGDWVTVQVAAKSGGNWWFGADPIGYSG